MSIDYAALATTAQELTTAFGRTVTLIRFDQDPADANEPWKGPADPRAAPDASVTVGAVFVSVSSASKLGMMTDDDELLKRTKDVAIIAPGPTETEDFGTMNELIDTGSVHKRITFVEKLQPASTALLYFVGVER